MEKYPLAQSDDGSFAEAPPTILLVDDDIELRRAMRDFLQASGCKVLEARNSYDGLFLCAQYGSEIDLLITEIDMLPVSGIKLAENVLRLWPQIQVLCMSESHEPKGVHYWMNYLGAEFLRKPFSPFDLHEKVYAQLQQRYRDAPMGVFDVPTGSFEAPAIPPGAAMGQGRSNNVQDPMFWLKEF